MAKSEKELQDMKNKVEEVNKELKELSEEELEQVLGGGVGQNRWTMKERRELLDRID